MEQRFAVAPGTILVIRLASPESSARPEARDLFSRPAEMA
jgi:hypothetical protein